MQVLNLNSSIGSLTAAQLLALVGAAPGNVNQSDQVEWSYYHVPGSHIVTPNTWNTQKGLFTLRINSPDGMRVSEEPSTSSRCLEIVGNGNVSVDVTSNPMKFTTIRMVPMSPQPITVESLDPRTGQVKGSYRTTKQDNGKLLKLLCSDAEWINIAGVELLLHSVTTFN